MQNSNFTNMKFQRLVEGIQEVMPVMAITLLLTVYAISGAVAGKFLGSPTLLGKIPGGALYGYLIGFAIQATRALLVFFRQLNPVRPVLGRQGEMIAAGMGVISIYEIWNLSSAAGMGSAVAFSLGVLMLAGIGIEIFLLDELRFHNEMRLYKTPGYWQEIEGYYQAKSDFDVRMRALKKGERIAPPIQFKAPGAPKNEVVEETKAVLPFSQNGHGKNGKVIAGTVDGI